MARRLGRRKQSGWWSGVLALAAIGSVAWWIYPKSLPSDSVDATLISLPSLTTDRPEVEPASLPRPEVSEKGTPPDPPLERPADSPTVVKVETLIDSGRQAVARGDLVAARSYFSDALNGDVSADQRTLLQAELTRLGGETVFSGRIFENDPFVERYVVQVGDTLGKIATARKVSADLLARVNGMQDKNVIRVGQVIKVVKGPFRAVVDCESYTMGLYLGNVFVRQFRVGLGSDDSTPRGEWRVGTKLVNPTYYPPRGGPIIAADDPDNPLGEYWIGLHGISGEAVGQQRYGIHGTNEPDSIGRSVSLGCIRMYNQDVEAVYSYLVEEHSTVIVR